MNELQIFSYEGNQVRTVQRDGETWWVLKDVCDVLGIGNSRDVTKRLDDDEKNSVDLIDGIPGNPTRTIINESGLYSVIVRSDKPEARQFQRWVTREVLPSIRKTGMYATPEAAEKLMNDPDFLIRALEEIKAVRAKNAALEVENTEMRPKARFADAVTCAETDIPVGELAKILRGNGVDIGEKRLLEWMRDNRFLMRNRGADWGEPTQKAMERGLFRINETAVTHSDGRVSISRAAMVTGKGQQYFTNLLLGKLEDEALTKIVLDERTWARDIIRTRDLGDTPMRALACVARHYLEQGLDTDAVRERVNALYNKDSQCAFIDVAGRVLGEAGKRGLLYITSIPVTQRELQTIRGIDGVRRQRVAFALLALAKYQNHAHGENHDWVNFRHKDVFSMANVKVSVTEQYLLLNDLKAMGLLKYNKRVDNLNVRVLYADHDGEPKIEIHDMRNLGFQYMRCLGGGYIECRSCGAVTPRKSPRQLFCPECARLETAKRSLAHYHKKMGLPA